MPISANRWTSSGTRVVVPRSGCYGLVRSARRNQSGKRRVGCASHSANRGASQAQADHQRRFRGECLVHGGFRRISIGLGDQPKIDRMDRRRTSERCYGRQRKTEGSRGASSLQEEREKGRGRQVGSFNPFFKISHAFVITIFLCMRLG